MNILVTGASGFVGSWLANMLLDQNRVPQFFRGAQVRILARSAKSVASLELKGAKIFIGDVSDASSVTRASEGADFVFHLAGVVGYSKADRPIMQQVNVDGTQHVVDAIQNSKCKRLVHMSSVAAVGASIDGRNILNENSPFNLSHLNLGYFETKRAAEQAVLAAVSSKKIDAVVLNPSNIYGPGDAQKGSRSTQIKVARGQFKYYTSGGVSIVHVEEVCRALLNAATHGRNGERYILSGENIRIREMFELIAGCAGVAAPKIHLPDIVVRGLASLGEFLERRGRKGPVASESARASLLYHWFDSKKAQTELGFVVRPAKECINDSVMWMKSNGVIN